MAPEEVRGGAGRVRLASLSARPILLVGAAGLVGRHLREAFADRTVVATFHRTPDGGAIALDVTDPAAVRALVREAAPDLVLLAAAEPHVERCEREPAATRAVNVEAARTVAAAAAEAGAYLVVFSSEYVFAGGAGPYGEDDATAPLNEYGRQKVELEAVARSVPRHLVCRTSGVYGWEPQRKNFVCQLVDRLRAGATFDVPSDQVVTPTDAPSLARAVRDLALGGHGGIFNVVGPVAIERSAFARLVARAFALDERLIRARPTSELGLRATRPQDCGLRDAKLRAALGHGLPELAAALAAMRASEPSGA